MSSKQWSQKYVPLMIVDGCELYLLRIAIKQLLRGCSFAHNNKYRLVGDWNCIITLENAKSVCALRSPLRHWKNHESVVLCRIK